MNRQMKVSEMTDREYRTYKRALRRRRAFHKKCLLVMATICLVLLGTISYQSIRSSAHTQDDVIEYKYYTNVTIGYGETLWNLADEYIDYEYYKDKNAYITEVCSINHLQSDSDIIAGQKLIVPYYSDVFVK